MLDAKDPTISNGESQQYASDNNVNTVTNNTVDRQENGNFRKLDDNTLYDNMIFPS